MSMPKAVTVTRSTAPQETTCTTCGGYDYDIELPYYYYPTGMLTILIYAIVIVAGLFIAVQAVILGAVGIILFVKRNIIKCPNCKKVFKKENKNLTHCPYCGKELKPHD